MTNQLPEFAPRTFNGIVRTVATVDVQGVGPVHFERPCLYHMGQKHWHIDFSFEVEGKRYWGTVWNRNREVELRGVYESAKGAHRATVRLLPDTAKRQWRDAIRRAAYPFIDAACAAYVAYIDAGDTKRAERVAMGRDIQAIDKAATLPPAFDESLSNDAQAATMAGRETATPIGDIQGEAATDQTAISAALIGWNKAKRNGDARGLHESGDVLAELLATIRDGAGSNARA